MPTMRSLKDLKPYALNAKKHDPQQIANIAESLKQFGWRQPIVIDSDGVVVIGHGRLAAAQVLGWSDGWVVQAEDLTPEQIRKLRIIDNKTNESAWDFNALAVDAQDIDFSAYSFDDMEPVFIDEDYSTEFTLKSGDREHVTTMSVSFSRDQLEEIDRIADFAREHVELFNTDADLDTREGAIYAIADAWLESEAEA